MPIKSDSLTNRVADEVSRMILEGRLRPRLGVSHTVMREALRMLETRGLVQVQHGKGVIVSLSSAKALGRSFNAVFRLHAGTLSHLMEVRSILETEVAQLAAQRRTDQDLAEMEACLRDMERWSESPSGYVDGDVAFHNALVEATHNPVLINVVSSLQDLLIESREKTFRGPPQGALRALRAHHRLYDMVKAQDALGAREAMLQHLRETQEDIEIAIKEGRLNHRL